MRPSSTQSPGVSGSRGLLPVGLHERAHTVGLLRALAEPVVDARQVESELRFAAASNGIEKTHQLEARAALTLAAVRDDQVIEGLVARAAARQADRDHGDSRNLCRAGRRRKRWRILQESRLLREFRLLGESRRNAPLEGPHEPAKLAAFHAHHDALHLEELLEQAVHV